MKLHDKSFPRWVITLILLMAIGILPRFSETVWAHGPELGEEDSSDSQKKEETGPHGGQAIEFGDNHLEFTADHESGEIVLFLLDENLKAVPVAENYSGVVYLTMNDGSKKKTLKLNRGTEGPVPHLEAETGIKEIGAFKAVVSLNNGERRQNFRFNWAPASDEHEK